MNKNKKKYLLLISILFLNLLLISILFLNLKYFIIKNFSSNYNGNLKINEVSFNFKELVLKELIFYTPNAEPFFKIKEARIKFNLFKLLNKLNFISSVEKIYLIEPFFFLLREKTGQWKYLSRIKEKSKIIQAEQFKFPELKLNIKDGELVIEDHFLSNTKFYFNSVNLKADLQNNGEFILETFLNSSPLKLQGYFNAESKQLNLNLNIPRLTLNFLNLAFMDDTFIIKNGYSNLNLFCKIPLSSIENLDYQGELNLKNGEAVCKNIIGKFNNVSGKIKIANQYLYSSQLKGIFKEMPFKLSGEIYDFTIPQLNLSFISDKIKLNVLENFFPKNYKLKLEGIAKGELNLKGSLNNLNYKLILFSDYFKINQKKYQTGFINLEFSGKNYKIKKLLGKDKNFLFSAEGWIFPSIKHPKIFLKGKLQEKIFLKLANSEINNKINFNCLGNLQSPIILGSSNIQADFLKVKPIKSNFIFNDQNLLIENLKNDNFLSFRGLMDLRKNLLNLNLNASNYNFAFNFNKIKVFGSLWGGGQITGNLNNPSFFLQANGNLSINSYKLNLKDLNLIGNFKTGAYYFMDGESKTGNLQIKGRLNKNLKSLALIKLNNFKLNNFFPKKIIQGETNLEALALINKDYLKLFSQINFHKSLFLGIPICEAELELKKYKSHPAYLSISLKNKNDFQTNFQGLYEKNNLNFNFKSNFSNNILENFKFNNFNFKNLKNFLGWKKFKGDFFLSGKINGSIKNPRISTYFKIPEAYINNELINLDGEFNYFFPKLNLTKFNLKLKNQFLGINGILNFKENSNLNIFADKIEIASLSNLTPLKNLNLSGILKGNLQLSGIPKEPKLSGEVNLNKLNFKGQEIESFDLKFKADKKQSILKNLDLTIGSEKIQGEGIYDYLNGFNLKFYTNNLSLENIPFLKRKLGEDLKGKGSFSILLTGAKESLKLNADFHFNKLKLKGEDFSNFDAKIFYFNKILNLDLALKNNPENYQLEGNIYSPQGFISAKEWFENYNLEYLLNFKISEGNLSVISKFLNLPSKNISGNLNLNSSFYGTLRKPQFKVESIFDNLKIEKTSLALLEGNLSFKEGVLSFDKFIIKDKDNISQIKGNLGEKNNLEISLKNLNLNFLEAFLYEKFKLNGELSLNLNLKGNIFKPLIDSKFQILKGDFQGFKFDSFKGEIQGKDGFIDLNNWKIKRGKHLATGSGRIPLIWKKGKYLSASPIDVKINLEEDDLDIFNIFGDLIRSSKGKLSGELKFSGPLTQINTQGEIKINNAEAQFTSLENPIKKLNLIADLSQNILTIKKFEGESGGKFNLKGKIFLTPSLANNLNLSLSLKDFLIINPKYFQGKLNGDIYLKENLNKSNLWGTLKISDGSLNLNNFQNKTSQEIKINNKTFFPELALDLHLERVWINNQASILRTFFKSNGVLEFRGRFPNQTLQGNLDFSQGQIIFYNTNFKLTDGKAYFDASTNWDPNIEIDAETSISGNKIYLSISGNINRPVWEAHSDPPLTKQEITQLLAGKFIPLIRQMEGDNISQKEFSQYLMGTLQMNLIQPFFHVLEQNLSFGDLSFEYILPGFWSIKIAKALDKDDKFYLTYSRVFGISGEIYKLWGLEYKLQRKMILRISQDIKNNFIFGIQSHYNF